MVMVEPMSSEPSAPKLIMGEMAIAESIMHMIGGELVIGGEWPCWFATRAKCCW